MPAPTAKKAELTFNSDPAIPLPEAEKDDELLLDAPDLPDDPDLVLQRVEDDTQNTEMVVDEEDRPRFAPGKDVVSCRKLRGYRHLKPPANSSPIERLGLQARHEESSYQPAPLHTAEEQLGVGLYTSGPAVRLACAQRPPRQSHLNRRNERLDVDI